MLLFILFYSDRHSSASSPPGVGVRFQLTTDLKKEAFYVFSGVSKREGLGHIFIAVADSSTSHDNAVSQLTAVMWRGEGDRHHNCSSTTTTAMRRLVNNNCSEQNIKHFNRNRVQIQK